MSLLLAGLLGIDASLRHQALKREHEAQLRESVAILTATLAGVERSALDWAHWNNMYAWVQGRNPSFVTTDVETTPLFDEGGLFLILNPDGSQKLSYGLKGHDHPSYRALFGCARQHLDRLPSILSRISLLCRSGDGILYLGVATPLSNSTETAPALGTLVMLEPLLKASYGPAFNRPLEWIIHHLRRVDPEGEAKQHPENRPAAGVSVAPALGRNESSQPLGLTRPLFTEGGDMLTLSRDPILPDLLRGIGLDALLGLAGLGALLSVRMLLLNERRRVRLLERRSQLESDRRIRRASHDLDRLLTRLGPAGVARSGDERVLARLIEDPASEGLGLPQGASMERKLERLADRFQHFLKRAKQLALLDPLTQLPNRRYFIEQVQLQLENTPNNDQTFAILFVDIDKFKNINDSYGHGIGDEALVLVAQTLRSLTRAGDFLGRYGGDEFAILMDLNSSGTEQDGSHDEILNAYASRIIAPFEKAVDLGRLRVELSISVGISLINGKEPDLEAAMRRSDIAMYRAKQNSQARVAIFDQADNSTHLDTYKLYVELMQSIRDRQFQVLFQPILNQEGELHALEALTRWRHPRLGIVGPEVFVDLAERYRQMSVLSDELIGLSLAAFREIGEGLPKLRLSLNLPPSKLTDPQLLPELTRRLDQHGISTRQVTIELTERSVLRPNGMVKTNLANLRECGIAISLDDFGTGYSSLSLLSALQPDEVKIDKSFVMAMQQDDYARQIVTLIADMAPRMNLLVVAEGVENDISLTLLRELGIRYFQGFHFSRPLTVAELRGSPLLSRFRH